MQKTASSEARHPVAGQALAQAGVGQRLRLLAVHGGTGLRTRLAALGLLPGVEFRVLRKQANGPLILAMKHSRILLGRGMAQHLEVEVPHTH